MGDRLVLKAAVCFAVIANRTVCRMVYTRINFFLMPIYSELHEISCEMSFLAFDLQERLGRILKRHSFRRFLAICIAV